MAQPTPHILAVAADPTIKAELHDGLGSDFKVTVVETADAALATLDTTDDIQCIVSDHDLPDIDGIGLLESVRVQHPDLPFIIFTSEGSEEFASRAIHAQVTDYLITDQFINQWSRLATLITQAIEYRRVRLELTEVGTRVEDILQALPDAVIIHRNNVVEYANERARAMLGRKSTTELVDRALDDVIPSAKTFSEDQFHSNIAGEKYIDRVELELEAPYAPRAIALITVRITWEGSPAVLSIVRNITERKSLQEDLEEAIRQLQVIDRVVRHNLHNRINVIQLDAETILEKGSGDIENHAANIIDEIENLLHTVDKERDITQLLANSASPEPVDLAQLVETVVDEVREEFPTAEVTFEIPNDATVSAIPELEQVIEELVRNAIIHSDRDQPEVDIFVRETQERIEVRVADNGPGIPDMERKILTEGQRWTRFITAVASGSGWSIRLSRDPAARYPSRRMSHRGAS